ncbi:MAG: DUF4476 domain-containing protein [Polyangiaceae bacterium]|nr:DUF4476 domain-containing protein [Polyangiaceae bacterium]
MAFRSFLQRSNQLRFAAFLAGGLALSACGGGRETVPLNYPGDSRIASEPLAAAIARRGYTPVCKPGEYCKFKVRDGLVLFRLRGAGAYLIVEMESDLPDAEQKKAFAALEALGQEIWNEAAPAAMAREAEARRAAEIARQEQARRDAEWAQAEAKRRAEEAARVEKERAAAEAARREAERQAALQVWDAFTYEEQKKGAAFKVVTPERVMCRVDGDSAATTAFQLEVPFQFPAIRDVFYTFDCDLAPGVTWHKKLQAREGFLTVIYLKQGGPVQLPASPTPVATLPTLPPPPPPATQRHPHRPQPATTVVVTVPVPVAVVQNPAPTAMDSASFTTLTAAVQKESFSDGKLKVIQLAAAGYFTAAQVGALVDLMTFSDDKVKVVEMLATRIVDPQNAHTILSHFTFSTDKEKVTKILTAAAGRKQ